MGKNVTIIRGYVKGSSWDGTSAVITGAADAALQNLSVANLVFQATQIGDHSSAIYNQESGFRVNNVTVSVSGNDRNYGIINAGVDANYANLDVSSVNILDPLTPSGVCFGFWARGVGNVEIRHSQISVKACNDSTALQDNGANIRLINVQLRATCSSVPCSAHGVWNVSGVLTILRSKIEGLSGSITLGSDSDRIINTHFNGPVFDAFPDTQCRGTYGNSLGDVSC